MLVVQTPAGQFLKLPKLVQHFVTHQKFQEISLLQFLKVHYSGTHRDADWPEDEQLPFKHMQQVDLNVALLAPALPAIGEVAERVPQKISLPHHYCPQLYLNRIFHPPQPVQI